MTDDVFQSALINHRAGRLGEAETLYREVLAQSPNRHDVQYLLALAIYQLRNDPEAIDLLRRAIAANPNDAEYHCNLGVILADNKRFEEALAAYQKALELNPQSGEAFNNLANALLHLGRMEEAADACRRAVEFMPDSILAHYNLGNALAHLGQPEQAAGEYRQTLAINPNFPEALSNLGSTLNQLGHWHEAADASRRAIKLRPNFSAAHNNLAGSLIGLGQLDEAVAAATQAIRLQPKYAEAYANLGNALKDLSRFDEAIAAYRQAISLRPEFAPFQSNVGVALLQQGKADEAMIAIQRALVLDPNLPGGHNNLAGVLKEMGRIPEAVDSYRRALELDPKSRMTRDNLILAAHYHPDYDAASLRREAEQWAKFHAAPLYPQTESYPNDRNPNRPPRIGYVSPDFRDHVLGHILLPLIRGHDHLQYTIYCYSNARKTDSLTEQFQAHADGWRDIHAVTDDQAAKEIRDDRIDILVDLALYTAGNRLSLFARKPAPVQVAYLAYPGTSGLKTMDFRLSDPYLDPADSDLAGYTEKTIRLPHSYWLHQPGPSPDVAPPPSAATSQITFGCLNNAAKISQPALDLWADLLSRVPNSRLLIHSASTDQQSSILAHFTRRGIGQGRIEFAPRVPWPQFAETFRRIDIALDPFPFGGGVTTCDTLWMGVPVVTLSGATAVGRGGRSILSNIGLPELIANSPAQYVQIAADLAANPARLTELRQTMRDRMKSSPLMNAAQFVREIESAYRQMWQQWCARPR
jgi:protein O-GlcNAc transferase